MANAIIDYDTWALSILELNLILVHEAKRYGRPGAASEALDWLGSLVIVMVIVGGASTLPPPHVHDALTSAS